MKSVPRHGVYWEMEFVRQWYRFWMECPLEKLVGTPAGHCDNQIILKMPDLMLFTVLA